MPRGIDERSMPTPLQKWECKSLCSRTVQSIWGWVDARASVAVASEEAGAHYNLRRFQHERPSDSRQVLRIIRLVRL